MALKYSDAIDEEIAVASILEQPKPALVRSRTKSSDALSITPTVVAEPYCDIEHIPVEDDPRAWSNGRKVRTT